MSCYFESEAAYLNGNDAGVVSERERIVALLRQWAGEMLEVEPSLDDKLGAEALRNAADQLERGP